MSALAFLLVALVGFLAGGFAVPAGFYLRLGPIETYVATVAGGVLGTIGLVYVGATLRRRVPASVEAKRQRATGRLQPVVDRYGARGLGIVGPIFPGVMMSVILGLALGLERRSLAVWLCVGIAILYGVYTVGLWLLLT